MPRRDMRLAAALLLFLLSIIASAYQGLVIASWMDAAVQGQWGWFSETYSVEAPPSGPSEFCFGRCASELPFHSGWLAIGSFLVAVGLVAWAWWRPKG